MSTTAILICTSQTLILAGIAILLIRLYIDLRDLHNDLQRKHLDLVERYYMVRKDIRNIHESLDGDENVTGAQTEKKPEKQRIYWRDENGKRRWRKNA